MPVVSCTRVIFEGDQANSGPPQPSEAVFVVPRKATIDQMKDVANRAADVIMEKVEEAPATPSPR